MTRRFLPWLPAAIAIALALVATGSLFLLPAPRAGDDDPTQFSAHRAKSLIDVFADEPHSVLDVEAHAEARDEVMGMFRDLGYEPVLHVDPIKDPAQPDLPASAPDPFLVENIVVRVPGASDRTLMLTAHYDSATGQEKDASGKWMHSPGSSSGAADDGYGVASILETLRAIKADGRPLEHSLLIVITDAEEIGLHGAHNEMLHHRADYEDVELIYNLEARGTSGPAMMFETSENNAAVTEFFLDNVPGAFTTSFMTAVYRNMPNTTDLTVYLDEGFTGLNTAAVGDVQNYHAATDNPDHVNLRTLQHYGEQTLGLTRAWAFSKQVPALTATSDLHFFPVMAGVTLRFPEAVSIGLGLAALVAVAAVVAVNARRVSWKTVGGSFWGLTWRTLVFGGAPQLVALVLSYFDVMFALLTTGRMGLIVPWIYLIPMLAGAMLVLRYLIRRWKAGVGLETVIVVLGLLAVATAACLAMLPAAIYLFALPTAALALTVLTRGAARVTVGGVACAVSVVVMAPITWLLAQLLGETLPLIPVWFAMSSLTILVFAALHSSGWNPQRITRRPARP